MKANADWLMANPKVKVRIEGNCDERGTIEYNQALGQRRAQAPGIPHGPGYPGRRVSLVSYGRRSRSALRATRVPAEKQKDDFVTVSE